MVRVRGRLMTVAVLVLVAQVILDARHGHVLGSIPLTIENPNALTFDGSYLWLTENEWRTLVPEEPKVGLSVPVADGVKVSWRYASP